MSRSSSTSDRWQSKQQAAKPITKANIATIKKRFVVAGRVKVLAWAPYYAVSDCGRLFGNRPTLRDDGLREITPSVDPESGYRAVDISLDGRKKKTRRVHQLVAELFVENKNADRLVRHWDGDPGNNHYSNLVWGNNAANYADSVRHGTAAVGSKAPQAKAVEVEIAGLRLMHELGLPIAGVAAELGYGPAYARELVRGDRWKNVPSGAEILAAVEACIHQHATASKSTPVALAA